jgi:hypothetical protein
VAQAVRPVGHALLIPQKGCLFLPEAQWGRMSSCALIVNQRVCQLAIATPVA